MTTETKMNVNVSDTSVAARQAASKPVEETMLKLQELQDSVASLVPAAARVPFKVSSKNIEFGSSQSESGLQIGGTYKSAPVRIQTCTRDTESPLCRRIL